jgi:hypothetical protein
MFQDGNTWIKILRFTEISLLLLLLLFRLIALLAWQIDILMNNNVFTLCYNRKKSRDSSVGIVHGYGPDDRGSRVHFPAEAGNFSLHHRVQNGSGAHPASYPMRTGGSFPGGEAAGAWSWPLTSM